MKQPKLKTRRTYTFSLADNAEGDEEGEGIVLQRYPWEGSDRDYHYEEVSSVLAIFNLILLYATVQEYIKS